MDLLHGMRAFRLIVDLGGVGRAAADLGLSGPGLSKQLRALEARLGVVLIQRTTRSMSLTEAGRTYYADCCRILDDIDALERTVGFQSQAVSGRLRINAPMSFALVVLSPLLPLFLDRHPDLDIDLSLDDRMVDAVSHGFDVTLRLQPVLADSTLIARKLGEVRQVVCASPDYLHGRGRPLTHGDLAGHDHLVYTHAHARSAGTSGPGEPGAGRRRVQAGNSLLLRDLLRSGLGIGSLPSFLADPDLDEGRLVRVWPDQEQEVRGVYAVYPTARHLSPKVKAFIDFLARELPAGISSR